MPLTAQTLDRLRGIVDGYCADTKTGIPGTTVVVVDKDGEELFTHSAGKRGVASAEPMTTDNIFWIASCTKMLTGVACLQLVEQGRLSLDDGTQLESLCPELKTLKVLKKDGTLEEKRNQITLRMLLSHTAGFSYSFFNERLRDHSFPAGIDEFSGRLEDMIQPLMFQPGEGWEYGVNIDWAGIALERVTGLTLNDYLQAHVLGPLGIKEMSMIPNESMRSRMAYMNHRERDGTLRPRDHLQRLPLVVNLEDKDAVAKVFNSGGAGMYAKPQEYASELRSHVCVTLARLFTHCGKTLEVLAVLLNDGTCPKTGTQILRKETVEAMFENNATRFPNLGRQGIPAAKPDLTNPIPDIYPVEGQPPQGWGLTFMLTNGGATGRSKSAAFWAGLANLWWWCDREKGVAGFICTQVLPFADAKVLGMWVEVESEVYKALR